jgi:uncharacterized protein involved in response to NO
MAAIPRYHSQSGPALLSGGFRPFFLLAASWAALIVPIWIAFFAGLGRAPTTFSPFIWHSHEMVFGFGAATVAGFLLTAVPNWTGRMPLQGLPLASLALLWLAGRIAVSFSAWIGPIGAAVLDLAFPAVFLFVIAREIVAGGNWRNLPVAGALALLFVGNLLTHLESMGIAETGAIGARLGVATLLLLVALIGGRIIPSFTRNWLAKQRPEAAMPASFDFLDRAALAATGLACVVWVAAPEGIIAPWCELAAGLTLGLRLARWRGQATLREPLIWILHLGYGWLSLGFLLLALSSLTPTLPQSVALHALTVGAIGTMMLAVMTRASLGHTGRPLTAGPGTTTIYALVTLAAVLRLVASFAGSRHLIFLSLAAVAWSGAFGLFALLYSRPLSAPRVRDESSRPI